MSLTNKSSYRYHLPPELIAQYPLEKREDCRLLYLNKNSGSVSHLTFPKVTGFLRAGDVLVLNNTKVFPARLRGHKDSGAKVEVLLLKELDKTCWECLVRPGSRLKSSTRLFFSDSLQGTVKEHLPEGRRVIEFHHNGDFWQQLESIGEMPLPPYIKRSANRHDFETYQTVYASERGSAAAPTAGLHFTEELLEELKKRGVIVTNVLLHIGLDTFRPVKVENILDHTMHREFCSISAETAEIVNLAKREGRRVIAVGTTTVRTLESFAVQRELCNREFDNYIDSGSKWTDLFIHPGFQIKVIDGLLTNFHLPESTLLMLVATIAAYENIMNAYRIAVEERYRFFSYGDAMLIL